MSQTTAAKFYSRIHKRLFAVGLSEEAASVVAGKSTDLIRNFRRNAEKYGNRPCNPSDETVAALSQVLWTTPEWLLYGIGPEHVVPSSPSARKRVELARKRSYGPRKNKYPYKFKVTEGDESTENHSKIPGAPPRDADLMERICSVIGQLYTSAKRKISASDIATIAISQHTIIMASCQQPKDYDHAIELMRVRLARKLMSGRTK